MSKPLKQYPGAQGAVSWDARLCLHIGECGRADNAMFEAGRDPWCQPDLVGAPAAAEIVRRCPTGSLAFHPQDPALAEVAQANNTVVVSNNGPLYLRGALRIDGASEDMPGVKFRAALCRCGHSKNKPYCDNSHEAAAFIDRGAVGASGDATTSLGGPLAVKPALNGPLLLTGSFSIVSSSGRSAWRGTKAALCRCGASKNKPFCDGAHKASGFSSES